MSEERENIPTLTKKAQKHTLPELPDANIPSKMAGLALDGPPKSKRVKKELAQTRSQAVVAAQKVNSVIPKVPGRIAEVEMTNFMCHSRFRAKFDLDGNNCFYILGPNGSGKSALFAGLNIGLGGKSKSMERGNSLQGYIKEGRNSAQIKIVLTNEGSGRMEEYDKEIVIQRSITPSVNNIALYSREESGKESLVSKKKADLDKILQRFSIELENPLAWLSQDRSRRFLSEADPKKFYQIFMSTTQLEFAQELYEEINILVSEVHRLLNDCKKKKDDLKKELKNKELRLHAIRNITKKKIDLQNVQWLLLFAPIRDIIKKIESIRMEITTKDECKQRMSQRLEAHMDKKTEIQAELEALREELVKLTAELQEIKKSNTSDAHKQRLEHELRSFDREIHAKRQDVQKIQHEIEAYKKQLTVIMGNADRDFDSELAQIDAQQHEIKRRINELAYRRSEIEKERSTIDHHRRKIDNEILSSKDKMNEFDRHLDKVNMDRENYEAIKRNQIARFGRDAPRILDLLERHARAFERKPIGPLGMYITLKDAKWAAAIESQIGRNFEMFICNSGRDRKTFETLLRQNRIQPPELLVTRFSNQYFDTRAGEPPANFLTIARAVQISDPTVYNTMIDTLGIEGILLVEQDDQARRLMRDSPPQNSRLTLTLSCAQAHPSPQYRFYANNKYGGLRYLVDAGALVPRDFKNEIDHITTNKQKIEFELTQKNIEKIDLENQIKQVSDQLTHVRRELSQHEKRINDLEAEKAHIQDVMLRNEGVNSIKENITQRKEDIESIQKTMEEIKKSQKEKLEEMKTLEASQAEFVQEMNKIRSSIKEVNTKIDAKNADLLQIQEETNKVLASLSNYERKMKQLVDNIDQLESEKEKLEEDAKNKIDQDERVNGAQKYAKPAEFDDPPDLDKVPETHLLEQEQQRIIHEIRSSEAAMVDNTPLTMKDFLLAKKDYVRFSNGLNMFVEVYEVLQRAVNVRNEQLGRVMTLLQKQLRDSFKEHMSMRNYEGDLIVDHANKGINIRVAVDQQAAQAQADAPSSSRAMTVTQEGTRKKKALQDLKGLSGGERSYATACFVMSLWECMDSPFRCLDEFDVYMDMLNRRMVMEMLVDMAQKYTHKQFFFFTPQGIQGLTLRNNMQVFEMPPIDRRDIAANENGQEEDPIDLDG